MSVIENIFSLLSGKYIIRNINLQIKRADRFPMIIVEENMKKSGDKKISTDPFGAYTGRPKDPADKPVQDADDL